MLCQNCGKLNDGGQNYCRHCGAPLTQPNRQTNPPAQSPKPYGLASPSSPLHDIADTESRLEPQQVQPFAPPPYQPPPSRFAPVSNPPIVSQNFNGYRCPRCGTSATPIIKKKVSSGGWIVFVAMLLLCFPLFFIGLLMREDYCVCPACLAQIG